MLSGYYDLYVLINACTALLLDFCFFCSWCFTVTCSHMYIVIVTCILFFLVHFLYRWFTFKIILAYGYVQKYFYVQHVERHTSSSLIKFRQIYILHVQAHNRNLIPEFICRQKCKCLLSLNRRRSTW